ncbi:MAG: phosphotransferase [Bacilli bacterium]
MSDEQLMNSLIKEYAHDNVVSFSRLMGGMSNYTYHVIGEKQEYTFRIPGKGASNFVDRNIEQQVVLDIKDLDLMPQPIYFDVASGYKIAPYIKGKILSEIAIKPYQEIAKLLKKLHQGPILASDYKPLKRLEKYEKLINNEDKLYHSLKAKWLEIYETKLKGVALKATHGDSQVSNFIIQDNGIINLVDWEFAGNNDPIYDIACFGNVDFEDAMQLLNAYFTNPSKQELERLYAWRMFQCLQWHNVAMYKHIIGLSDELMVDFAFFANAYLSKAKQFLDRYLSLEDDEIE